MSRRRENAPLVEVVADVKWEVGQSVSMGSGMPDFLVPDEVESFDKAIDNFGELVAKDHSYREKLVPANFPYLSHQPVYRFANRLNGEHNSLFQLGSGVFSIHAVPPYESWGKFREIIETGLYALLKSRRANDAQKSTSAINLRYIDAFRKPLTGGKSTSDFLSEVLGIDISLPSILTEQVASDADITPYLQVKIPVEHDFLMLLSIGEGSANGEPAIIMDTTVTKVAPVSLELSSLMEVFEAAHSIIYRSFDGLTKKIEHLMPESET